MEEPSERLSELLIKYENETCSPEEWSELIFLAGALDQPSLLKKLITKETVRYEQGLYPLFRDMDKAKSEKLMKLIISSKSTENSLPPKQTIRKMRYWMATAAAILVLVIAGFWWLKESVYTSEARDIAHQEITPADILPGTDGAILELGDGSTIVLDSSTSQLLTMQGNTKLIHIPGSGLTYEAVGKDQEIFFNTLRTAKGRQFRLGLPDGTIVWLNAGSSIRYPTAFLKPERVVEITGEVFFDVAACYSKKDGTSVPFIVKNKKTEIRVLGTEFNVKAYNQEGIFITLLEGSVRVSHAQKQILLKPGQQAKIISDEGITLEQDVDVDIVMAWKNGFFMFDQTGIVDMMQQAARWYDIEFDFPEGIPQDKFGGTLSRNITLSEFLKILDYSDIKIKSNGRKISITP